MIAAAALAVALSARATPQASVERTIAKAERLIAAQADKDIGEIRALDRKAEALSRELEPLGWKAIPALAGAARDPRRHPKLRLLAASFLALTRDPAALAPLEDILLDAAQPADLRALAAQSLSGLGAPDAAVARPLCAALAQEGLPPEIMAETLPPLARIGCPDPAALSRAARSFGPRPSGRDAVLAKAAIAGLGRSHGNASGKALLELVPFFPEKSEPRAVALEALAGRRAEIGAWLKPAALSLIVELLRYQERQGKESLIPLIRLASALGPDAVPPLYRLRGHSDVEVQAAIAEALAALQHVEAIPDLDAIILGAAKDPRFADAKGRAAFSRVEKAVAALRRARVLRDISGKR